MEPLTTYGLLTGGAALLGGIGNWASQYFTNKSQKDVNQSLYDQQRSDALSDWDRTNAYNSPVQQMQRLREAGLNPNLVYGSGAANTAAMVRSTSQAAYSPQAPRIDPSVFSDTLGQIYNLKQQSAQTDNIKMQTELASKEKLYKDAQIAALGQNTATSKFQLEQSQALKDSVIERARLDNVEKAQSIDMRNKYYSLDLKKYDLQKLQTSNDTAKTLQSIIESKQRVTSNDAHLEQFRKWNNTLMKQKANINDYDLILREKGINPSDPTWLRMMAQYIERLDNGADW